MPPAIRGPFVSQWRGFATVNLSSTELINRDRVESRFSNDATDQSRHPHGSSDAGTDFTVGNRQRKFHLAGRRRPTSPLALEWQIGRKIVVTDSNGHYEIALPEGRYLVTLPRPLSGLTAVKDLPSEVQIQSGHRTRLDIRLDTGIR